MVLNSSCWVWVVPPAGFGNVNTHNEPGPDRHGGAISVGAKKCDPMLVRRSHCGERRIGGNRRKTRRGSSD